MPVYVVLALLLLTASARAEDVVLAPEVAQLELPELARRDVALRTELDAAAARERHRGWLLPVAMSMGGGLVAVGAALPTELGALALPLGAHVLLRGTLALASDDARKLPAAYAAIPTLPERVRYGQRRLAKLARQHRRNRLADGIAAIVLAAAAMPLRYGFARLDDPHYHYGEDFVDYVLITLSALGVTQGALTLADQTPAEAAWANYQHPAEERKPAPSAHTLLHAHWQF